MKKENGVSEKIDDARSQVDELCEPCVDGSFLQNQPAGSSITNDNRAVIDFCELISRGIDEEIIEEIVPLFISDNKAVLEKLVAAVEAGNASEVRSYAHAIKGSAANVGAKRISEAALRLERKVSEKDLSKGRELLEGINSEFERLESLISKPNWGEKANSQNNRN